MPFHGLVRRTTMNKHKLQELALAVIDIESQGGRRAGR